MSLRDWLWLACLLSLACVLACGDDDGAPRTLGGETNWLSMCTGSDQCGAGLECLCGVCTVACEPGQGCSQSGASCAPTETDLSLACGSAPTVAAICAELCDEDAQCLAAASNRSCRDGMCVSASSGAPAAPATGEGVPDDGAGAPGGDGEDVGSAGGDGGDPGSGGDGEDPMGGAGAPGGDGDGDSSGDGDGDGDPDVVPINPGPGCAVILCQAGTLCCDQCGTPQCVPAAEGCPKDCYQPCAGKTCGDTCTVCDPADTGCVETADLKLCDAAGQCQSAALVSCLVPGDFVCGPMRCDPGTEYCTTVLSGVPGGTNSYSCNALGGNDCASVGGVIQNGGCRVTLAAP